MGKRFRSKSKKLEGWGRISHPQVYLPVREHSIDAHVYPVCQKLWDAGIETFYSCQGGPQEIRFADGRVFSHRAYVQILEKDAGKACHILKGLYPMVDINKKRVHKDRVAIRFDPSKEAKNIYLVIRPVRPE